MNDDGNADCIEVPGDDIAIATVVSFATEDVYRARDVESQHDLDHTPSRVFHEQHAGDAEVFDRAAIQFTDLGAGEGGHG